jgi:PAS domain-containing protein
MLSHRHPELKGEEYVVFADASRRYLDCSDGVCQLLGYSRAEFLKRTIDDLSYDVAQVPKLFAKYLKSGALEGEHVLQSKSKSPIPIRYKAFVFHDGCKAAIWYPIKDWRESYLGAILEPDRAKLKGKLEIALNTIRATQETKYVSSNPRERQAMEDARSALTALMRTLK